MYVYLYIDIHIYTYIHNYIGNVVLLETQLQTVQSQLEEANLTIERMNNGEENSKKMKLK
jgi:hypothetical protein